MHGTIFQIALKTSIPQQLLDGYRKWTLDEHGTMLGLLAKILHRSPKAEFQIRVCSAITSVATLLTVNDLREVLGRLPMIISIMALRLGHAETFFSQFMILQAAKSFENSPFQHRSYESRYHRLRRRLHAIHLRAVSRKIKGKHFLNRQRQGTINLQARFLTNNFQRDPLSSPAPAITFIYSKKMDLLRCSQKKKINCLNDLLT